MIIKLISHPRAWLAMQKDSGAIRQLLLSQAPFNVAPLPAGTLVKSLHLPMLHFPHLEETGHNYTYSIYLNRVPNASERIQTGGDEALPEQRQGQ